MEVVSPGVNGQRPQTDSPTTTDARLIVDHLVDLLEVTLGVGSEDLERPGSLLSNSKKLDTVQRCSRFASESQVVLYVQKDVDVAGQNGHSEPGSNGSSGKQGYLEMAGEPSNESCRHPKALHIYSVQRDIFFQLYCCFRRHHQASSAN